MRETVSAAATNPSIYVGDLARKIKPCANRPVTTEAVNPTTIPISKASGRNGPNSKWFRFQKLVPKN